MYWHVYARTRMKKLSLFWKFSKFPMTRRSEPQKRTGCLPFFFENNKNFRWRHHFPMSKQTQFLHPSTGVDVPVHRESLECTYFIFLSIKSAKLWRWNSLQIISLIFLEMAKNSHFSQKEKKNSWNSIKIFSNNHNFTEFCCKALKLRTRNFHTLEFRKYYFIV